MLCQSCGVRPAKRYVCFRYILGVIIVWIAVSRKGDFCAGCINKYFWGCTVTSLLLGWWGIISFFITPIFVFLNVLYYAGLLGSESPQDTHWREQLEPLARPKPGSDGQDECYLCGKPLGPAERQARVCSTCRNS